MTTQFLHGVEVVELSSGSIAIQTVASSVIGIIGTAPDSQEAVEASLISGVASANNAVSWTSKLLGVAGNNISVSLRSPGTNSAPLNIAVSGQAIMVSLATDLAGAISTTGSQLIAAITADANASKLVTVALSGSSSGAGLIAYLATTYLSGGIDEAFPLNTPVLIAGSAKQAAALGTDGTLFNAIDGIFDQVGAAIVVVRVVEGETDVATATNIIGSSADGTGVYGFLAAQSVVNAKPRILIAPGFTGDPTNGVVQELLVVANRLRSVVIADGPNTNDTAAISYTQNFGSPRIYMVDPAVKVVRDGVTVIEPNSSRVAGLISLSDNTRGFWWSPSNQVINGIVGTGRPIDFTLGDPDSEANILNASNIATIIYQNGYRLWGNRTLSIDPQWTFLSVRRTADIIEDSIQAAFFWAVDRNITKTFLDDVASSVTNYLRGLKNQGAIIDGKCWPDPDLNTPSNIASGQVYFNFDFAPSYPAEHITFQVMLNNNYLTELTSSTTSSASS